MYADGVCMEKVKKRLGQLFWAILVFSSGYMLGQWPKSPVQIFGGNMPASLPASTFAPFWEVWNLLDSYSFQRPLDPTVLTEGAINGVLATLDDHNTRYVAPEQQAAEEADMQGEFEGIGAEVTNENGDIVIVAPIEGSPAAAAGLQPGDILRQANGIELTGMDVSEAARLVRGPAGTTVNLIIERDGATFEIAIVRDRIKVSTVRGEILENQMAYVRLTQFGYSTDEELSNLLEDLTNQNPTALILDLRMNPGGSLDTVIAVADQFLPQGITLIERFGDGSETIYRSTDEGLAEALPMVVLIDEGSASASEVLAGALQDRNRAVLVGEISFGKGTVQTVHSLSNGGGVRITTAHWLTPNGAWVHEQGVQPDYYIPQELTSSDPTADVQLQTAIDYLLGQPIEAVPTPSSIPVIEIPLP